MSKLDAVVLLRLMRSPEFLAASLALLRRFATPAIPTEVLSHFSEYFTHLRENNPRVGLSFFFLLNKLFLLRSRGGFFEAAAAGNQSQASFENSAGEAPAVYLANQVIELFQEIVNRTVNLAFGLEKLSQSHRYRFQQVSNKMGRARKDDKPNHLKSMTRQMRIFLETLKSLAL